MTRSKKGEIYEETRMLHAKNVSINRKGNQLTVEQRQQISKILTGLRQSPETCAKKSAAHLILQNIPEVKERNRQTQTGKKRTGQALQNLRNANLREDVNLARRNAMLGRKDSAETTQRRITAQNNPTVKAIKSKKSTTLWKMRRMAKRLAKMLGLSKQQFKIKITL